MPFFHLIPGISLYTDIIKDYIKPILALFLYHFNYIVWGDLFHDINSSIYILLWLFTTVVFPL